MEKTGPEEIRFTQQSTISKAEYLDCPERFIAMIEGKMRENLTHFIQHEKIKTISNDFMIEKRLDIYAASPERFWEIVQREAEKIALRYMGR